MTRVLDSLLSLIYPVECAGCGNSVEASELGAACEDCWSSTRIFRGEEFLCVRCGAYLRQGVGNLAECGRCTEHFYDAAYALGIYEKALAASILRLKHSPNFPKHLRKLCIERIRDLNINTDVIVPLPLSKKRRIERGFNQAEVIARVMADIIGSKVETDVLLRKLHTSRNRAMMDRKGRELSVRNAFDVKDASKISGKAVLIIDDVFTTGATASSCAKVLKKNGAASVSIFTLARAV
jgi:ComF family protein